MWKIWNECRGNALVMSQTRRFHHLQRQDLIPRGTSDERRELILNHSGEFEEAVHKHERHQLGIIMR
jgi:hypothetical protein